MVFLRTRAEGQKGSKMVGGEQLLEELINCGGARRCACVRAVRGSGPSAGESAVVRRAKGKPRRGPGVVVRG